MMQLRSKENTICGIYCIDNLINNKKYIGQSVNIYNRWSSHKGELNRNCHHNRHLQNSWNKTPVLCVELNKIFEDAVIACKELGLNSSSTGSIHEICRGESKYRKTAGGYHWKYLENNI